QYDHEFPADWADSAADFIEHDKMTEAARDRVTVPCRLSLYQYAAEFRAPAI
ncbi:helix-turn-helix transcriptional regulator, partial [Enterobacter hormaechei]